MNYFEQYEKLKHTRTQLPLGTTWEVTESSDYSSGTTSVGDRVYLREVDSVYVHYSYYHGHIISPREYKRPIKVFTKTFKPILQ